jgi:tetratricopeptide (TPR) repeat protein
VESRLRQAIEMEPENAEAHFVLGEALFRAREYDDAAHEYRTAIECPPRPNDERPYLRINMYVAHSDKAALDAAVHLALGDMHRKLGRLEEALEEYRASIPGSADAGWSYLSSAQIYKQQGRLDLAIQEYRQAVRYDFALDSAGDIKGSVRWEFADTLLKSGDFSQAAEEFRRAIDDGCLVYLELAQALRKMGDLHAAIQAYRDGIECLPDRSPLRKGLAIALMQTGEVDAAIEEFQEAISRHPSRGLFAGLARAHVKKGDLNAAAEAYRDALERYPGWPPAKRGLERLVASHWVETKAA